MVYSRTNQLTLEKRLCSQSVTNVPLDRLRNSCFADMVKVIITGHKGGEETKVYPIASMETCWELKKRIAEDMEVPMDNREAYTVRWVRLIKNYFGCELGAFYSQAANRLVLYPFIFSLFFVMY